MPKEMLPILDKPIIQYVVEELVEAGIEDIVIVTSWDNHPIEAHFDHTHELEEHLREQGKASKLKEVQRLSQLANFIYIRQKGPYGNGTPALNAASIIGNEPFVYALGDDLVLSESSFTKTMIQKYEKTPGIYIGVQEVADDDVEKYGIIKLRDAEEKRVDSVVEKPKLKDAPSRLAVFGRYILPPEIFAVLKNSKPGKGNELWIADSIHQLIKQGIPAYYHEVENGEWLTTGDPINYLKAMRAYAMKHPEYKDKVSDIFV